MPKDVTTTGDGKTRRTTSSIAYDNIDFIRLLTSYRKKPKKFRALVNNSSNEELNAITEIIYNFLRGHLQCDTKKFKKHSTLLRLVGDKTNSFRKRRKALLSRGAGVIAPLLQIAVPALVAMFAR